MERQHKSILVIFALVVSVAVTSWLLSEASPKPQIEEQLREQESVIKANSASPEIPEVKITDSEQANLIKIDWNLCLDDLHAPECIEAITPLIAEIDVVGELGWLDLMDRLAVNMERVAASLSNPECTPPVSGFEPISDTTTGQCAARAFGELGALLRGCSRSFDGRGGSYERRKGRASIAAQSGITDLGVLDALTQLDRLDRLESTWLSAKCDALLSTLGQLPAVDALMDEAPSLGGHGERPLGYPWRMVRASHLYVEQAVRRGDYRVASEFSKSAHWLADFANRTPFAELKAGDEEQEASGKAYEAKVAALIEKIIEHDPAVGHQAMADHLTEKFPDYYSFFPSKTNLSMVELDNTSPVVVEGKRPKRYLPEEDWYQRTLQLLTHQIVAQRLSGVPLEVAMQNFDDRTYNDFAIFDEILDANDREYASQRANEIIAKLNNSG
jgi:hypothetical protein